MGTGRATLVLAAVGVLAGLGGAAGVGRAGADAEAREPSTWALRARIFEAEAASFAARSSTALFSKSFSCNFKGFSSFFVVIVAQNYCFI